MKKMKESLEIMKEYTTEMVEYMTGVVERYMEEAAKMDDEGNFVGHEKELLCEEKVDAELSGTMTGIQFDRLFEAVKTVELVSGMAFC